MLHWIWEIIILVFLLMPLAVTLIYSFAGRWIHILPEGFTLE